jgi:hypothetical protein
MVKDIQWITEKNIIHRENATTVKENRMILALPRIGQIGVAAMTGQLEVKAALIDSINQSAQNALRSQKATGEAIVNHSAQTVLDAMTVPQEVKADSISQSAQNALRSQKAIGEAIANHLAQTGLDAMIGQAEVKADSIDSISQSAQNALRSQKAVGEVIVSHSTQTGLDAMIGQAEVKADSIDSISQSAQNALKSQKAVGKVAANHSIHRTAADVMISQLEVKADSIDRIDQSAVRDQKKDLVAQNAHLKTANQEPVAALGSKGVRNAKQIKNSILRFLFKKLKNK